MSDVEGIQIVRNQARKASGKLIRLRRWLYFLSVFVLIYLNAGLSFGFHAFSDGKNGIGFADGVRIIGLSNEFIHLLLFLGLLFFFIRFVWFASVMCFAYLLIEKYQRRDEELDIIEEAAGGFSDPSSEDVGFMSERELASWERIERIIKERGERSLASSIEFYEVTEGRLDPEGVYDNYQFGKRIGGWFRKLGIFNEIILPTTLPVIVGAVAIFQLAEIIWWQT